MGLRTLIESVMRDHVGKRDSFKKYLADFRKEGYVTDQHAVVIEMVVDAGNAAVHRTHFPNHSDLDTCIGVVKNMMELVYILKPKMDAVAANTPKKETVRTTNDEKE